MSNVYEVPANLCAYLPPGVFTMKSSCPSKMLVRKGSGRDAFAGKERGPLRSATVSRSEGSDSPVRGTTVEVEVLTEVVTKVVTEVVVADCEIMVAGIVVGVAVVDIIVPYKGSSVVECVIAVAVAIDTPFILSAVLGEKE